MTSAITTGVLYPVTQLPMSTWLPETQNCYPSQKRQERLINAFLL
ncbi:hypothetical protein CI610_03410 [invertebrate metagenome]|uniref:Uncharacterized protein n=1 Tax=invertebrate metagenome TaxID=1711999 RepID=A0A2H9T356_9ZZZZ